MNLPFGNQIKHGKGKSLINGHLKSFKGDNHRTTVSGRFSSSQGFAYHRWHRQTPQISKICLGAMFSLAGCWHRIWLWLKIIDHQTLLVVIIGYTTCLKQTSSLLGYPSCSIAGCLNRIQKTSRGHFPFWLPGESQWLIFQSTFWCLSYWKWP